MARQRNYHGWSSRRGKKWHDIEYDTETDEEPPQHPSMHGETKDEPSVEFEAEVGSDSMEIKNVRISNEVKAANPDEEGKEDSGGKEEGEEMGRGVRGD